MPPEPLVSVVTPFHNTEAYLAECIESVLAQSYRNFEYVLVDNQSTDRSGAIAEDYARRDGRIRLIHTDRLRPQVPNYNFALEQIAPGSVYCKMVQADDWLFPRCLTEMVELAEAHPSVAVVSSYRMVEKEVSGVGLGPKETVVSGRRACRFFLFGKGFLFGSPTTVLYRGDVVRARRPFFELGRLHEDTEALYEILADRDFGFVHQVLSFSRREEGSIMVGSRTFSPDLLDRLIIVRRFGATYLEPDEYQSCSTHALKCYYRALAAQWLRERLRPRDQAFWAYHRHGLNSIGEVVRPHLLTAGALAVLVDTALSPERLLRHASSAVSSRAARVAK
jgi:glycosyltransferase involved in cell wall biosynthesis